MAKIIKVDLLSVPDAIHVGDNDTDITVVTKIEFHDIDIQMQMDYYLHLFVYDVHGDIDPPLILSNWDECSVLAIKTSLDRPDDFLGKASIYINTSQKEMTITKPMALKLGKFNQRGAYHTRKLEIFATAAPAIGRISKWSQPFTTQVMR